MAQQLPFPHREDPQPKPTSQSRAYHRVEIRHPVHRTKDPGKQETEASRSSQLTNQLHHSRHTISGPRRDHRPIAQQHTMPCLPSSATCLPAHANCPPATHPKITHLAHQPSAPNCSTITRTMNSPLPFCKLASYPRPNSATTPCSPILTDGSLLQQWTDPNTSFYRSWPAAAKPLLSTPTHALTSAVVFSARTLRPIPSHGQRSS
jgi:hypothetical protein